eukprot:SM000110S18914  [mRNA]  locus=s110:216696:217232:- [translate_table: standard]
MAQGPGTFRGPNTAWPGKGRRNPSGGRLAPTPRTSVDRRQKRAAAGGRVFGGATRKCSSEGLRKGDRLFQLVFPPPSPGSACRCPPTQQRSQALAIPQRAGRALAQANGFRGGGLAPQLSLSDMHVLTRGFVSPLASSLPRNRTF